MRSLIIWKNRIKKFCDRPTAILAFLRKRFYYNFISDSYISSYDEVQFLTYEETVDAILNNGKSIVRFGDELFDMFLGIGLYFNDWHQVYSSSLTARLKEVVSSRDERILVCFNPELILLDKKGFVEQGIPEQHHYWTHSRIFLKDYIHKDWVYGRALTFHNHYYADLPYKEILKFLQKKHLIIVTSNTARFKNVALGLSTTYVEAPKSNAWAVYDDLHSKVISVATTKKSDDILILASIGPTAKVLVYDMTMLGYTAWDTGQFFDISRKQLAAGVDEIGFQPYD